MRVAVFDLATRQQAADLSKSSVHKGGYGKVNEEAIDEILEAMQQGEVCSKYELT